MMKMSKVQSTQETRDVINTVWFVASGDETVYYGMVQEC